MSRTIRLALAQTNALLGDTAANIAETGRLARAAAGQGARLIVLPEGGLTGNALADPARQATLPCEPGPFDPLSAVARECGIVICAGFAAPFGDFFNIVHAVIAPDGIRFQRKAARATTEPAFLAPWPDPERVVFDVEGIRVALMICSEYSSKPCQEALARARPDLVLHPSAGRLRDDEVLRPGQPATPAALAFPGIARQVVERAAERIREAGVPRAGANPIGFDGEVYWPGNSYAVDAGGRIVMWLKGENDPARMAASLAVGDMPLPGS
jgi:predicted amidohydrolase